MNVVDKLLTAVEQFATQENRINTFADKMLHRFASQKTAQAGYCWTDTNRYYDLCRDRECCLIGGQQVCGPYGGWYPC